MSTTPRDTKMLIEWTSNQQMNWDIELTAKHFRFRRVLNCKRDTGGTSDLTISDDQTKLKIISETSWDTGNALIEVEGSDSNVPCSMNIVIRDPHVGDRVIEQTLQGDGTISMSSQEWPLHNCFLRLSSAPDEIKYAEKRLSVLSNDRRRNIEQLLKRAKEETDATRRQTLRMRAAAAASGGCNHGPLKPDGWDIAINTYQDVINEAPAGSDLAINAAFTQATCCACWSPQSGCDAGGRGKGDWHKAFDAYEKLHQQCTLPGDKVDALRRKAELECFEAYEWWSGLKTYRRIIEAYPGTVERSPHWTYRTCAPHCGTENIAWDIYRAMVYNAKSQQEVKDIFFRFFGDIAENPHVQKVAEYIG